MRPGFRQVVEEAALLAVGNRLRARLVNRTSSDIQVDLQEVVIQSIEAIKRSEEQAARTRDPYGEQNLKDAAKFLSTRIRDGKHGGDKAKFFDHLDDDNDGSITLEEIKAVEEHAAELNAEKPGGLWKMMHTLLETKSHRGFHGELHAHLDADGDGTVTSAEFHEL